MNERVVVCDYCGRKAQYVRGNEIYSGRGSWDNKYFWVCYPCEAWVGCHSKNKKYGRSGDKPLGRLANRQLREAKMRAHMAFDPMWKNGRMKRKEAYKWLSEQLGIEPNDCHIGMFNLDRCNEVVRIISDYELDK